MQSSRKRKPTGEPTSSSVSNLHHRYSDYNSENVVPACMECNTHLGSKYLITISDRAEYLASDLNKRSKKILKYPDWTSEELDELKGSLRKTVQAMQIKKNLIKERLSHMENMSKNKGLTPKDYWDIMIEEHGVVAEDEVCNN